MNNYYTTVEENCLYVWIDGEYEPQDSILLNIKFCVEEGKKRGYILQDGTFNNLREVA